LKRKKQHNDWSARSLRAKACNARLKTFGKINLNFYKSFYSRFALVARKMRALQSNNCLLLYQSL
jgi:hypothetical protein